MSKSATQIISKATTLGYATETETTEGMTAIIARDTSGTVRIHASYIGGRFDFGYTRDRMGHTTHHSAIRELLQFA